MDDVGRLLFQQIEFNGLHTLTAGVTGLFRRFFVAVLAMHGRCRGRCGRAVAENREADAEGYQHQ